MAKPVFCPSMYEEVNMRRECKGCDGVPGCWKQPNVEYGPHIASFYLLMESEGAEGECDICGAPLIKRLFTAKEIYLAAKGANILIIEALSFNAFLNQELRQILWSFDLAILKRFGDDELLMMFCPNCGVVRCGCHNPLIMDPEREYLCIFCGGF